jgi:hypothetical protein
MIKLGDYNFEGPWLPEAVPKNDKPCVYALLKYQPDGNYDVLFVGKADKFPPSLEKGHEGLIAACWEGELDKILTNLVERYSPPGNEK